MLVSVNNVEILSEMCGTVNIESYIYLVLYIKVSYPLLVLHVMNGIELGPLLFFLALIIYLVL